ncbi:MAG: CCA tRNA nucleotidyltransferase [Polyangiales bacterium]
MSASSSTTAPTPRVVPITFAPERMDYDAVKVIKRLVRAGHAAYLVGGCVRDLLLDRTPKDFDIATSARPNEVKNLFRNCRIIGRRFRLAHILFGGNKVIEVATFRKDPAMEVPVYDPDAAAAAGGDWEQGEEDGELPEPPAFPKRPRPDDDQDLLIRHDNVFGEPWEDAVRRDFTMNALFYDIERKEIVDYVGGIGDIERKVIRTIGDADVRFREDPVRILRVIKFAARIDLGIEPDVFDAVVMHREDLLRAARPRLLEEVLRLLRGGAARRSFWLAWETGVLAAVLPELSSFLDDDPEGNARLWRRLSAIDVRVADRDPPTDATLLTALLLEPALEALEGERDLTTATSVFFEPIQERLAIPRRLFDRMRQVMVVQRRIAAGRHLPLLKRDFYPESADLWTLDAIARGLDRAAIQRTVEGREGPRSSQRAESR